MGLVFSKFNSSDSTSGKFKSGSKQGTNDTLCGKTRTQMIAVTNYNGVSYTANSRILADTTYDFTMTVEAADFTESFSMNQVVFYTATVFVALISFMF